MAVGTRTAPAVNGTGSYKRVSISYIDYTGNVRTTSDDFPQATTALQIEAYVAAEQALSKASIYKVEVSEVYNSVGDSSNALEEVNPSVYDNVVFLAKTAANLSKNFYILAPDEAAFIDTTDQIDPANTEIAALMTAWLAAAGAGWSIVSARFSERRKTGKVVKI